MQDFLNDKLAWNTQTLILKCLWLANSSYSFIYNILQYKQNKVNIVIIHQQ